MSRVSQTEIHQALLDPKRPVPAGLSDGKGKPAAKRFAVYRNNVASSLTEALERAFPATAKLIGPEKFKALAGVYFRKHPPKTPLLMHYGDTLADFLNGFEPLAHIGYLSDVARLEQAIRASYHAADATPIDPMTLQEISPEVLPEIKLELAPSLTVITSHWPISAIWAFNMEDGPQPDARAQNVLITRPAFDPELQDIPSGAAVFIQSLDAGEPLGTAQESGTKAQDTFDLSEVLARLFAAQAITKIIVEHT